MCAVYGPFQNDKPCSEYKDKDRYIYITDEMIVEYQEMLIKRISEVLGKWLQK